MSRRRHQRGSSLIEFALSATLFLTLSGGLFDLGNLFLRYYLLQCTVRSAAEYGARAAYDSVSATPSAAFRDAVANIVVYGEPAPKGKASPLVPDLTREQVTVDVKFENRVPVAVTVGVRDLAVRGLLKTYQLSNKPRLTFPYLGQFTGM